MNLDRLLKLVSVSILVVFSALCLSSCSVVRHQGPKTDHFDGEYFFNPGYENKKSLLDVLKWRLFDSRTPWPDWVELTKAPENDFRELSSDEVRVIHINHSTLLISFQGVNILTDPVFSERVSPFTWIGPKRVHQPGIELDQLPPIHLVVISHNHYDHMDLQSLKKLEVAHKPLVLVPLGDGKVLKKAGLTRFIEMDWWQSLSGPALTLSGAKKTELRVHFTPALHWSGRWLNDRFASLWGAYLFESRGKKVYFAGDTGYSEHFEEIFQRFGEIDIAALPIGAYEPRWFMKLNHMNPKEARRAHSDLRAKHSVGIHFGTFQLTDEGRDQPLKDLDEAMRKKPLARGSSFEVFFPGQGKVFRLKPSPP